jgi:hypothetical protein
MVRRREHLSAYLRIVSMYVDTLSTLGPHSSSHPSISPCVGKDRGRRSLSGYEPFRCLAFGSAGEHQSPSAGGGAGIYFCPTSALHS